MSSSIAVDGSYTVPIQINGKEIVNENTFEVVSPGIKKTIWKAVSATKEDAVAAVEAAEAAFPAWRKAKPAAKRTIFLKAADILESRAEELCQYLINETGGTQQFATHNIVSSAELIRDVAGRIVTIAGTVPVCQADGTNAIVFKEPYGVILAIAPWNAPYILGFRSVIYALAAGNTAVLKGPELSPRIFWAIGSVFAEAGLPAGVLNVLQHRPQDAAVITETLIADPRVMHVNFTGSTFVGSIIAATAGKYLKPVLMELGGKASALILDDADLKVAAFQCAIGAFLNSGQICMSTERIVVHSSIAAQFAEEYKAAVNKVFSADSPAPVVVTSAAVAKAKKLLTDAVGKGAIVLTGDINAQEETDTRLRPVVLTGVKKDMEIYYQETFGPSVSVIIVESEEEAIAVANDTEYGLSSAVFTKDLARALRVAREIKAGAVHINSMTVHDEANLPHGGVKKSGWGRFNANAGLEEFLQSKTVTWTDY